MIKIADGNLVLHNVPLPEIRYADSTLTLELDDEHFRRKTVVFSPIQGIKLTANDCADIPMTEKSFSEGRYKRYVLEDTDSAWVKELRNGIIDKNDDFTKKTRHFIIDIGDELLEIAAWNMEIKPCIYVAAHRGYSEKYFEETCRTFIDISQKKLHNIDSPILSMGMSRGFEYAIETGSDMVRIGNALFSPGSNI